MAHAWCALSFVSACDATAHQAASDQMQAPPLDQRPADTGGGSSAPPAVGGTLAPTGGTAGTTPENGEVPGADASSPAPAALRPLIDHRSWKLLPQTEDPLASHRPATVICDATAWSPEPALGQLEVELAACNYMALEHPVLVPVAAGATVTMQYWHLDLLAPEPAEAHLALLVGDDVLWETHIDIPSAANAAQIEFAAPRDIAAGESLRWHVHNHGANSYTLSQLAVKD